LINLNLFHSFKCTSINKKFTLTVLRNTFSSKIQKLSSYMIMIESRRVYLTSVKLIFHQGCASLLRNCLYTNYFICLLPTTSSERLTLIILYTEIWKSKPYLTK